MNASLVGGSEQSFTDDAADFMSTLSTPTSEIEKRH